MNNLVGKIEIIREISRYSPHFEAGQRRGWSWYIDGMHPSGGWNFWKMYDESTYAELRLALLEIENEGKPNFHPLAEKNRVKANTLVVYCGRPLPQLVAEPLEQSHETLTNQLLWGSHR